MSRRISILVAATTSAVVLAFLIPLGLLVRSLAADRATADGDAEARNVAILVSSLHGDPALRDAVETLDDRSPERTTVLLADGTRLGSGTVAADDPDVVRARSGSAFTRDTASGRRTVVPVLNADGTDVVVTDVTNAQLRHGVTRAWLVLGALGVALMATALLIAGRIGRRISTPVTDVAEVADLLREGDLSARAPVEGPAETRALAIALNRLGERIHELLVAERATVGDLSHRLRTPVTALRIDVEGVDDPQLAEQMRHHVSNLQRTIDAIVKDARRPVQHEIQASCDAAAVVAGRVAFWSVLAEDQGRALDVELDPGPLPVVLDADDLADAVDILIDNVFAHTPDGSGFAVSLTREGAEVRITVTDNGGTAPTVGEPEGRSGLGLQIARRTAAAAAGVLDLASGPQGTTVTLRLPLAAESQQR